MSRINKKLSFSVIIPCYNEEGNISSCIKRVPNLGIKTEIIVVDDGSTDNTKKIAKSVSMKNKNVKVISYKPNKGKGYAVSRGLNAANNDVLLILDADMTVRPEDLPKIVKPIIEGRADFVNVTRFKYKMEENAMKGLNNIANRIMAILFSLLLKSKITDTLCGTKVFYKSDYKKIGIDIRDPWGDMSELYWVKKLNLRLVEVPVKYYARVSGASKMKFLKHGYKMFKIFFQLLFEKK